jgi:NADH-quinone oxidoreductase subunit L
LAEGLVRVRRISRDMRRGAESRGRPVGPFVQLALWLSRGARVDHLYQVVFVTPFVKLVRWLNGYGPGRLEDPVGTLPVRAALWLKEAVTTPLAQDAFDRLWTRLATAIIGLWGMARRSQSGRARDYALVMVAGLAALLLLAWGST